MRLSREKHDVEQKMTEPHQQSAWLIWLLSIVTFFLTVAIVLGLFWAGRWVVHRFTKTSTPTVVPVANNTRDQAQTRSGISTGDGTNSGTTPPSSNPSSSNPTQTKPAPTPTPAVTPPATTPAPTNLVNTGPSSDE